VTTPRLISLHVSPWSERAKWSLDHHGIAYRVEHHVPFIGERRLRKIVGPTAPRATVPVLIVDGELVPNSLAIARWADAHGSGIKLVPPEHEEAVQRWIAKSDVAMDAGRTLITARMLASDGALDESLPSAIPKFARVLSRPVTRYGMRWFARKYAIRVEDVPARTEDLRAYLLDLRAALAGAAHLLGAFTYADIVVTAALQAIVPVADRWLPLGPATRRVWTNEPLAAEFADLIAWRDALYERHRPQRLRVNAPGASVPA
jgi:glutathione S-transferase